MNTNLITIVAKNSTVYTFRQIRAASKPGALKLVSINSWTAVQMHMVPSYVYRQAMEQAS